MTSSTPISQILVTDVSVKAGGSIRLIELNRPDKLNCLSLEMLNALFAALQKTEKASAIVLTGAGRSFCTGLDFKEIGDPKDVTSDSAGKHLQLLVRIFRWLITTNVPVVVLAKGHAVGGGAGLVACSQSAVVSPDFRFKLPGGNLAGLACVALPLCNLRSNGRVQIDAAWLGRELDATAARQLGLVDEVVSSAQLDETILSLKRGEISPELLLPKRWNDSEVGKTLAELDRFLRLGRI
jgi:enoyl-CoA hydratase/carnithine racemase